MVDTVSELYFPQESNALILVFSYICSASGSQQKELNLQGTEHQLPPS